MKVKLMVLIQPLRDIKVLDKNIKADYNYISELINSYRLKEEQIVVLNREIHELKIVKDKYEKYEVYMKRKEDIEKIEYNNDCEVCVKNNRETIMMKDEINLKLKELWIEEFDDINKIRREYKAKMYKREVFEIDIRNMNKEELMEKQKTLKMELILFEKNDENERWNNEVSKKNDEYNKELDSIKEMRDNKYEEYQLKLQEQIVMMKTYSEKKKYLIKEIEKMKMEEIYNKLEGMKLIVNEINENKLFIEENIRKDEAINKLMDEKEINNTIIKRIEELNTRLVYNVKEIVILYNKNKILFEKNKQLVDTYELYEIKCNNEERLKNIEKEYIELMRDKINIERDIVMMNKMKEDIIINNEKLLKLYEEKDKYELLEKVFDKNGLSEYIMRTAYNDISESINYMTEKVCGYRFRIDETTNFMIIRDNKEYYIENGSGAEKLILNIAFRMTISNIKCISRSDMMIIDESFISFDKENRNKIEDILEMILTKYKRVLVISHMEELQDIIKERINIRSERGISYIL
jgi:DNA repair exonuclease SbcCD ATPase subunit